MARMADRMLAKSFMGKRDEALPSALRSCERIIVDDVSEYLYAGTEQEEWDWSEDFPNLAPPFPIFWMEAIAPKLIRATVGHLLRVPRLSWRDSKKAWALGGALITLNSSARR